MMLHRLQLPADHPSVRNDQARLALALDWINTRLGRSTWLAGNEFSAADIMNVFALTTFRIYLPLDLSPWPQILAYLQRVGQRPAYQAALHKSDPDLTPMLSASGR
jgi:glutathione S-transferase